MSAFAPLLECGLKQADAIRTQQFADAAPLTLGRSASGVVALDGLDLVVQPNEIVGLIGPNGSGKTTFFNVVTGIYGANAGSITFDGADITNAPSRAVYRTGITLPTLAPVAIDLR